MNRVFSSFLWLLLSCFVLSPGYFAFAQDAPQPDSLGAQELRKEMQEAAQAKPQPGERCIVCGMELKQGDGFVLLVRGRRIPVADDQLTELLRAPEKYFSKLQPKGAWFSESSEMPKAGSGWLCFGLIVLGGVLIFGFISAKRVWCGVDQNKQPKGLTKVPHTAQPVLCKDCGAANHPTVSSCSGCGAKLEPEYDSEVHNV